MTKENEVKTPERKKSFKKNLVLTFTFCTDVDSHYRGRFIAVCTDPDVINYADNNSDNFVSEVTVSAHQDWVQRNGNPMLKHSTNARAVSVDIRITKLQGKIIAYGIAFPCHDQELLEKAEAQDYFTKLRKLEKREKNLTNARNKLFAREEQITEMFGISNGMMPTIADLLAMKQKLQEREKSLKQREQAVAKRESAVKQAERNQEVQTLVNTAPLVEAAVA